MLLLLCIKAAASPGPLVGVRICEASNPGPSAHRFDIAEPDWSEHESDAESIRAFVDYLEAAYADSLMNNADSPHDADDTGIDDALHSIFD